MVSALALAVAVPTAGAAPVAKANAAGIERVSVSSTGAQAQSSGSSSDHATVLSRNGRFTAFTSRAANLVPGDTNGVRDAFVRDRQTGATERVSFTPAGGQVTEDLATSLAISPDGRYVTFRVDPIPTKPVAGLFMHDRQTGATIRLGERGDDASFSPDGRYVAHSLEAGGVRLRDLQSGATQTIGSFKAWHLSVSNDARFIAFSSSDTQLVPNDTNGMMDVFVHDRQTQSTSRVSVNSAGQQAVSAHGCCGSSNPYITPDGRYVAFLSSTTNLVPNDTNVSKDAFVRDRQTNTTERLNLAPGGGQAGQYDPYGAGVLDVQLSDDARRVVFSSDQDGLVAGVGGYWGACARVFLRDRQADTISVVDTPNAAAQCSFFPQISPDGLTVAFASGASDLVPGDTNGSGDVFIRTY